MAAETLDLLSLPRRTGNHNGRTLYAMAPEGDVPLGMLDTAELAAEACAGHNERLSPNPAVGLANAIIRAEFKRE